MASHLEFIMRVEGGSGEPLSPEEYIDGVAALVADGTITHLQGSWQRAAASLIDQGFIDFDGTVIRYPDED